MLTEVFQTYCLTVNTYLIVYGFLRFPKYDKKHIAGGTIQQRMLIWNWAGSLKLELLTLKWGVTERIRDHLLGNKFIVITDNNLLNYLSTANHHFLRSSTSKLNTTLESKMLTLICYLVNLLMFFASAFREPWILRKLNQHIYRLYLFNLLMLLLWIPFQLIPWKNRSKYSQRINRLVCVKYL